MHSSLCRQVYSSGLSSSSILPSQIPNQGFSWFFCLLKRHMELGTVLAYLKLQVLSPFQGKADSGLDTHPGPDTLRATTWKGIITMRPDFADMRRTSAKRRICTGEGLGLYRLTRPPKVCQNHHVGFLTCLFSTLAPGEGPLWKK